MKYIVKDRREGGELVFLNIYFLYLIESWKRNILIGQIWRHFEPAKAAY